MWLSCAEKVLQLEPSEWEVSDIEEGKGISVHGIPIYVSPMKESSKTKGLHYFV